MPCAKPDAKGPASNLQGAPENGDQTRDLYHGSAARRPCMEPSCSDHAIALVHVAGGRPRLEDVHSKLGPCRRGRGGSRLGGWRLRQRRLLAPHTRLNTARHGRRRPLLGGAEAAETALPRGVKLRGVDMCVGLACAGLWWLWYGATKRQERVRDVSIETTLTPFPHTCHTVTSSFATLP